MRILAGALLAVSVVLSNSAAMLLSVAFINMLKGGGAGGGRFGLLSCVSDMFH